MVGYFSLISFAFINLFNLCLIPTVAARNATGKVLAHMTACYDVGFMDYVPSTYDCQFHCTMRPTCNTWGWVTNGTQRCHFCSSLTPLNTTSTTLIYAGWRANISTTDIVNMVNRSITVASGVCSGNVSQQQALDAAEDLNLIINAYKDGLITKGNVSSFATKAAQVLSGETDTCRNNYTSPSSNCLRNNVLFHQLRALLLYVDGNATRAFPTSRDLLRRDLFNNYKLFMVDNGWFSQTSLSTIADFHAKLPSYIRTEGLLYDAEFVVQGVADAWTCNGTGAPYMGVTNRGFNVFQTQVLAGTEPEFPIDTPLIPPNTDSQMVVTRHETSHQIDRIIDNRATQGFSRLQKMKASLISASAGSDLNWLRGIRSGSDAFFQSATQEIIASHVGNQYMQSSTAQLRLAASRLLNNRTGVPMSWFLFFVEIFTKPNTTVASFYDNETKGNTTKVAVALTRDSSGRINSLKLPYCDKITVGYNNTSSIVNSVSTNTTKCKFACVNDATWSLTGKGTCTSWVSGSPLQRCDSVGDDGRLAKEACLLACEVC